MTITRQELQDYNAISGAKASLIDWVTEQRANKKVTIDVKVSEPKAKVSTERTETMEMLDSMGIEYKKNAKTSELKELLLGAN